TGAGAVRRRSEAARRPVPQGLHAGGRRRRAQGIPEGEFPHAGPGRRGTADDRAADGQHRAGRGRRGRDPGLRARTRGRTPMIRRDARCAMWTWAATAGAAVGLAAALAGQARVFRIKKVGEYPNFIALSGNGRVAYVTSFGTGELLALDLGEKKVVRSVPVGDEPLGLAVVESEKAVL